MRTKFLFSAFLVLAFYNMSIAQEELQITSKDSIVQSSWILGIGFNAVDDSGNVFDGLFNVGSEWNFVPYPSRVSIGKYFKSGLGVEAIGTYSVYKEGNIVDGEVNPSDIDYFGLDARLTYDLNKIVGQTGWFDPYVGIGLGYTDANNLGRGTYNAIVGFRTWFSDTWGLDFNSSGKWAMSQSDGATNHIQHAVGVVYQFGIEKGLSKRGEEKMELLAAIEKEKQRQADSIAEVNRQREEALLAEKLKREKEAAKLAAAEKAAKDKKEAERRDIQQRIDALGKVYFKLNSSSLTSQDEELLGSLTNILNENPTVVLEISAHTDARGTETYNQWLSEKRLERTVAYLKEKGIASGRIIGKAKGETELTNNCTDGVRCTEAQHQENRRLEFLIQSY
ncbi:OmpA family protein [Maribacter sp. PR1]|uniref:OmpA family protein n=1 Tax=Maribacter cobaltidurans TaxID=1178778 RepID=A0ABU7IX60_9FLAO|nr:MULTISPECIES: OmpA family protein [Maribacter]MDC6389788.1 OmpA family protein [Maribacter sp. PR1]MEE1977178.1 OmpA family protein [Maribacter cobaltidurans]